MSQFYDPQSAPPPKQNSNTTLILVIVLLVVGLLAAAAIGLGFMVYRVGKSAGEIIASAGPDFEQLDRPADDSADAVSSVDAERPLVEALRKNLLETNVDESFVRRFDIRRMTQQMEQDGFQVPEEPDLAFHSDAKLALVKTLGQLPEFEFTSEHELRDLKLLKQPGEALATIRCRYDDGTSSWLHWWLRKSDGRWRVYDMQSCKGGVRLSTSMAVALEDVEPLDDDRQMQAVRKLVEASQEIDNEDWDDAERKLRETLDTPLKGDFAQRRWLMLAHAGVEQGFDDESSEWLDKLDDVGDLPRQPFADYFRAVVCNRQGLHAQAQPHAEAFLQTMGAEADAHLELGRALAALGHREEAADAFRKGLADYPNSTANLAELASVVDAEEFSELGEHLGRFSEQKREKRFENLAERLIDRRAYDALDALVQQYRRLEPRDPNVDYYAGIVLDDRQQYDQAAAMYLRGMQAAREDRDAYVDRYVESMLAAGWPLEAYREVPGERSFRRLAEALAYIEDVEALEELVALHRAKHARDVWLAFYGARVKIARGEFKAAAQLLKPVLKGYDRDAVGEFKALYYEAVSRGELTLQTYRGAEDQREAFRELAGRAFEGQPAVLLELIETHREANADDPWLAFYEGLVDREAGRYNDAVEHFRGLWQRGVDEQDRRQFVAAWLNVMQLARRPVEGYRELKDKREAFALLAGNLWDAEDLKSLEQLIDAHRAVHPQDPWLGYFQGRLAETREQYDTAAEHYRDVWQRADEADQLLFVESYLHAMRRAGRAVEGYRRAPEPRWAFESLAYELDEARDAEALSALVAAHQATRPGDPLLPYYMARAQLMSGDYEAADRSFAKAWKVAPNAEQRNRIRSERVEARYRAGRGLSAYGDIEPAEATFHQLAWLLLEDGDAEQLAALVDARRTDVADDPDLSRWRIEILWLNKDYAGVLDQLAEHEDQFIADDVWWYDAKRVRAHLRLQQPDEALAAAEVARRRNGDPFLLAVAHAAAGNAGEFQQAAEACFASGDYGPAVFYDDDDAGPALEGKAFEEFRKKYPPVEE